MYLVDYHLHTNWSSDGKNSMEEMVKKAIEKDIKEVCLTDHFDLWPDVEPFDYSEYIVEYQKIKKTFGEKIKLRLGIELGISNQKLPEFSEVVRKFPFDYVLASTHRVDNISPTFPKYFEGIKKIDAYLKYYEYMLESVKKFDDFDCWGHLDYVIRYGNFNENGFKYFELSDILDEIFKILISKGKGIEMNSSYRRMGKNEFHPSREILKRYFELGGEIVCFGSDAHRAEHIGSYVKEAYELLFSLGQKYLSIFEDRRIKFISINGEV